MDVNGKGARNGFKQAISISNSSTFGFIVDHPVKRRNRCRDGCHIDDEFRL